MHDPGTVHYQSLSLALAVFGYVLEFGKRLADTQAPHPGKTASAKDRPRENKYVSLVVILSSLKVEPRPNRTHNIISAMSLAGYSLPDMLPAYPGKDEAYLDQLLHDNDFSLNRPLISYGLLSVCPCRSRYFNITEHGFRSNGREQPWPPHRKKAIVFFFGGSTTLGLYLEDHQTIPAQLQRILEAKGMSCEVYNFGSGSYTSRHDMLRFLDLLDQGIVPDRAIFLDGLNDCYYTLGNLELVQALNELYQAEKRRRRSSYLKSVIEFSISSYKARHNSMPNYLTYEQKPRPKEIEDLLSDTAIKLALGESNKQLSRDEFSDAQIRVARLTWEKYCDSMSVIRVLARRKGVKTLFAWQPVPLYKSRCEQRVMERLFFVYRHSVFSWSVYNWLHAFNFSGIEDDPGFIDLSGLGEAVKGVLYSDVGHYSVAFCKVIANAIATKLASCSQVSD